MKKYQDIFMKTGCLSEEMLMEYTSGKLSFAEKHEIEKHLIDCEMCSDAVEGLNMVSGKKRISEITLELNQKIQQRAGNNEIKIIFFRQYRTQLAIAASIVVTIGIAWFFRSNVSISELDNSASKKIFADKFEPYSPDEKIKSATKLQESAKPESEVAAEKNLQTSIESRLLDENQKNTSAASRLTKQDFQNKVIFSQPVVQEAEKIQAVVPEFNSENIVQADSTSLHTSDNISKQPVPGKLTFGNANSNRLLNEGEHKQQNKKPAASARSKSDEAEKSIAAQKAQSGVRSAPVTNADATIEANGIVRIDSVREEVAHGTAAADAAMQEYNQKNYSGAAEHFEKTLEKDPDNYNALLYSSGPYLSPPREE